MSALFNRPDSETATPVPDTWAEAANRETRRQFGVSTGPELTEYSPPPDKFWGARCAARVYLDELMSDAEAAARGAADVARAKQIVSADDAWSSPGWSEAAADYHMDGTPYTADELARLRRLMADDVTLERAWHEINHPTGRAAESTVDALMRALRERGTAALAEPETRRRLADLSSTQVREVLARLMALRPSCPAINDELLFLLGEQLYDARC
jgi:hypothetical protein